MRALVLATGIHLQVTLARLSHDRFRSSEPEGTSCDSIDDIKLHKIYVRSSLVIAHVRMPALVQGMGVGVGVHVLMVMGGNASHLRQSAGIPRVPNSDTTPIPQTPQTPHPYWVRVIMTCEPNT